MISGTRDLFLSNTVRVQEGLLEAGVEVQLLVMEGESHGDYLRDDSSPETRLILTEISKFLDTRLGK